MFKISFIQKLLVITISITIFTACKKEINNDGAKPQNEFEVNFSFINSNRYNPINTELLPDTVFQIPIKIEVDYNINEKINYYEFLSEFFRSNFWGNNLSFSVTRHENTKRDIIIEYLSYQQEIFNLPVLIIVRKSLKKGCIIIWDRTNVRVTKDSLVRIWEINKYTPKIYSNLSTYFINGLFPKMNNKVDNIKISQIILDYNNSFFQGYKRIGDPGFTVNDTNNFFSKIKIVTSEHLSEKRKVMYIE